MADTKITLLDELITPVSGDWVPVVDVSDTSMAASGTTKKLDYSTLLTGLSESSKTANYVVLAGESGTYFDNTGDTNAIVFTLPAATVGLEYTFIRKANFIVQVEPDGAEYFQGSAAGSYKQLDSVSTYIYIKCFLAGTWHVMAASGSITDE